MVVPDKLMVFKNFKKFKIFVGIDVSKLKLDVAVVIMGVVCTSFTVKNNAAGFKELLKRIQKLPDYQLANTMFCMESTGIYHITLAEYLAEQSASVWVENAYTMKHSQGLVRGKSDKLDARLIGEYAYRHADKFRPFDVPSLAIRQLEAVHKQRSKLLKIKQQILLEIKEYEAMEMLEIASIKREMVAGTLESIDEAIKTCRKKMKQIIQENEELKALYDLVTSVEGVDLLMGVYLIFSTGSFKRITNARKYATMIGIVSFEHQSGSSSNRRKGTSKFADMVGKKMITNAMGNAIRRYGGLRPYYERKIKEGKPANQVLNACKNKLVHRIFAVVKSGKPYDKFHQWQPK